MQSFSQEHVDANYPRVTRLQEIINYILYRLGLHWLRNTRYLNVQNKPFRCTQDGKIIKVYNHKNRYRCSYNYQKIDNFQYSVDILYSGYHNLGKWTIDCIDPKYVEYINQVEIYRPKCDLSNIPGHCRVIYWPEKNIEEDNIIWPEMINQMIIDICPPIVNITKANISKLCMEESSTEFKIIYRNLGKISFHAESDINRLPKLIGPPTKIKVNDKYVPWDEYPNKTETVSVLTKSAAKV